MMEITGSAETDSEKGGGSVVAWRHSACNMMFEFSILSWKKEWNQSEDGSLISMAGDDLSKSSWPSLFGDRALWPHEALALRLIPHVWKRELGKIGNAHGWAGRMPEATEQMMPASNNISGQFPLAFCSFQHIVSACHRMIFITFIYRIHFTMQNTFIFINYSGTYISLVISKSIITGKFLRDHFSNIWIY